MNTELLVQHLKQLQNSFKAVNELAEIYSQHGDYVETALFEHYPFQTDFNELTLIMTHWTNEAIEKLQ